ncbi:MAG: alpha/beta fold hydrolase [Gammaproteobacteria bacterium]
MTQSNEKLKMIKIIETCLLIFCCSGVIAAEPADQFNGPVGEYVGLADHRLHLYCTGENGPTIIFEPGIGGSSLEWFDIQQKLAGQVKSCAYDRGGYGWSDPGPGARDVSQIVKELRFILNKKEIKPPYIFVGHSFGGYIALYHAQNHADETAGLILVDSSHPEQNKHIKALLSKGSNSNSINPMKIRTSVKEESFQSMALERGAFLNRQRKAIFAQMNEIKNFRESGVVVSNAEILTNTPMIVLTRSFPADSTDKNSGLEKEWLDLQRSLTELSTDAKQIVVENSGHSIHLDQPEVVIDAISNMVDKLRLKEIHE